jgi:DNA-binding MarR family transcriptional regulator
METSLTALDEVLPVLARLGRILERTDTELPLPQYRLLSLIARGENRASRLAARLPVTKPTVTFTVDALLRNGLLQRNRDDVDARVSRLTLTDAGRAALRATNQALTARIGPYLEAVSDPPRLVELLIELGVEIERQHDLNRAAVVAPDTAMARPS